MGRLSNVIKCYQICSQNHLKERVGSTGLSDAAENGDSESLWETGVCGKPACKGKGKGKDILVKIHQE